MINRVLLTTAALVALAALPVHGQAPENTAIMELNPGLVLQGAKVERESGALARLGALAADSVACRQTYGPSFAGARRTRLRKPRAVALCRRNARFLAGLCAELGLQRDAQFRFSFDWLLLEQYCRPLVEVLDERSQAQRRYQVWKPQRQLQYTRARLDHVCVPVSVLPVVLWCCVL